MPFDLRMLEARLALHCYLSDDLPAIACDALEAGFDAPSIRRMAGLLHPTGFEVDILLPEFIKELGVKPLTKEAAAIRLAQQIAAKSIEDGDDPLNHLPQIERLWMSSDHPEALANLAMLSDELEWDEQHRRTNDAVRQSTLEEFKILLDTRT